MNTPLHIACALLIAGAASAQVVANDSFSYVGALTGNGWTAHSGAGNKVITSDGSVATLEFSSGSGEDAHMPFAPLSTTAIPHASFTLNVPSGNLVNPDGSGSYFAHFRYANTGFRGRAGLLSPAGSGDFGIGINASASNIGSGGVWASDLSFDTNYTIVINWDAATGTSQLWVDPANMGSTSVSHTGTTTPQAIDGFALRQSNDHTGFITIDDIIVGNSFADVAAANPANTSIPATSPTGCSGALVHSTVDPAGSPASWAGGTTAILTVTNLDPLVNLGILVFGNQTVNIPIFGGLLIPSPDVVSIIAGSGGVASLSITIPPGLGGNTFYTQFAGFDSCVAAGELTFSNGQSHLLP